MQELAFDRFLRRLVRVLVATAVREALGGGTSDALLELSALGCETHNHHPHTNRRRAVAAFFVGPRRVTPLLGPGPMMRRERRATAPPAPPTGLVLLEAGYDYWPLTQDNSNGV